MSSRAIPRVLARAMPFASASARSSARSSARPAPRPLARLFAIEFARPAIGGELGGWQAGDGVGDLGVGQVGPGRSLSSIDGKLAGGRHDFPAGHPLGGLGPGAVPRLPVKQLGKHSLEIRPVPRVVGLQHQASPGDERSKGEAEKLGGQQATVAGPRVIEGLGMKDVDGRDAVGGDVRGKELASANDGTADIREPPLVGPAGGVANDDGERVDGEMIALGMLDGTVQR